MEWADSRKWISLLEDKEDKALMNPVELWEDLIMTKIEVYFYVKRWCPKSKIKGRKAKDKSPDEEMSPSKEKFMNLELMDHLDEQRGQK